MRNFRTAAVASATALTVFVGGTAIASAEENDPKDSAQETNSSSSSSSVDQNQDAQSDSASTDNDRQVIFVGEQKEGKKADGTVEADKSFGEVISDGTKGLFDGKGSSHYFSQKDNETPFYPTDAFGKKTNVDNVPQWARYWIDGSIVAAIGALVGLVIAGFNFAFYNNWLENPLSR